MQQLNGLVAVDDFLEEVELWKLERTADLTRKALDNFIVKAGILAGTLVVALAGRLSLLVAGWLVTSISVAVVWG